MKSLGSTSGFCGIFLALLFVQCCAMQTKISPLVRRGVAQEDTLWRKCGNITEPVRLENACVTLSKAANCELRVVASVAGASIINNTLDFDVAPITCGTYLACNICVSIDPNSHNTNQRCANIRPECIGQQYPPYEIGCFDNTVLSPVLNCIDDSCPGGCSGHGVCDSTTRKCKCDSGYYGADCSAREPMFEQCVRVDDLSGDVCLRLKFTSCSVNVHVILMSNIGEIPMYSAEYPMRQFVKLFAPSAKPLCMDASFCKACLTFNNLQISDTVVQGCAKLSSSCVGVDYGTVDLGCFSDDQTTPACFVCPNNCNGRGMCQQGTCYCSEPFTGEDCTLLKCPNDCSKHGTCDSKTGECHCSEKWSAKDCSQYAPHGSKSEEETTNHTAAIVLGVLGTIGGIAFLVALVYFIRRRMSGNSQPMFRQLDLIEEEEELGEDQ